MKVFVAGATGVIGRRAVRELVAAGHDVSGIARTPAKAELLRRLGAVGVTVDLFDGEGLRAAVAGHDAVVNLATHIPAVKDFQKPAAWAENERIRREASGLLVDAALAGGATVFVQEALAFYYEDAGDRWIDESAPLVAGDITDAVRVAEANARRFGESPGRRGVVLRFGRFYAPDSELVERQLQAARWGVSLEIGTPDGYQPLIDVDDAATAVVAALDAPSGTYNVVDDEPMTRRVIDTAVASLVGRKRLRRPDRIVAKIADPDLAFGRSNRVSNRLFRDATGWAPRSRNAAEGLAKVFGELEARPVRIPAVVLVAMAILALSGLAVGIQATFFPESFYDDFPFGMGWVSYDPPFNEHLIRDVGALQLGLGAIAAWAYLSRRVVLLRAAALGWLLFNVPHAVFHVAHLGDITDTADQIGIALGTVGPVVFALIALVWPIRRAAPRSIEPDARPSGGERGDRPSGGERENTGQVPSASDEAAGQGRDRDGSGIGHRPGLRAGAGA